MMARTVESVSSSSHPPVARTTSVHDGVDSGEPSSKRRKTDGNSKVYKMAYLGPPGTYGEMAAQAFRSRYDQDIKLVPCLSIPSIWDTPADFHVMPLENRIHGGVTETLDSVLSVLSSEPIEDDGDETRRVKMDLALPIRHCLVAKKGTKMEDIEWVRSHEQALGQSSVFLSTHLPGAQRQKWTSTAAAAVSLLEPDASGEGAGPGGGTGAAICSKGVVRLYPETLEVLHEGTQAVENNYTRFLLFGNPESPDPRPTTSLNPSPTAFYALPSARDIGTLLANRIPMNIHPRPAPTTYAPIKQTSHVTSNGKQNGVGVGDGAEDKFPAWYLVETIDVRASDGDRDGGVNGRSPDVEMGAVYLGSTGYRITEDELNAL